MSPGFGSLSLSIRAVAAPIRTPVVETLAGNRR
jgi:hypothetical protein